MPRFSANLGFLFLEEASIVEQYVKAANLGFKAVEHPFPAKEIDHDKLLETKNKLNLDLALVNIELQPDFKFGCASISHQRKNFEQNFKNTLNFAKKFGCKKIHLMSGKLEEGTKAESDRTYLENLKYVAEALEVENDIIGVIEPINHYAVPDYFLHDYDYAVNVINQVASNKLKIMVDLFHMQIIQGNIINTLKDLKSKNLIGHIQIAQAPYRNEPNSPGEVNFKFILDELEKIGYDDYIGCEYKPLTTANEGIGWIQEFDYQF